MMMKRIFILLFGIIFLSSCSAETLVKKAQASLGTIVEISVADQDQPRQLINTAISQAFTELKRVEDLFSRFKPDSEISQINAGGHLQPVNVSSETISLLEKAEEFSRLTNGAFDITIYPLMEIWGLAQKSRPTIPTSEEIRAALEKVGYQNIAILKEKQAVFLARPGMSLDLGAIATGYAVDEAILVLRRAGIKNALVNAGGDIYALGRKEKNQKWRVAVQHPRQKDKMLTVLELENQAVATSGDYQRYIEIAGRRFSHIINPHTGFPCADTPASVTVLAEDCLTADALATSLFVLGPEKGIDLVNRLKNTEALVASSGEGKLDILLSRGLEGKIKIDE